MKKTSVTPSATLDQMPNPNQSAKIGASTTRGSELAALRKGSKIAASFGLRANHGQPVSHIPFARGAHDPWRLRRCLCSWCFRLDFVCLCLFGLLSGKRKRKNLQRRSKMDEVSLAPLLQLLLPMKDPQSVVVPWRSKFKKKMNLKRKKNERHRSDSLVDHSIGKCISRELQTRVESS